VERCHCGLVFFQVLSHSLYRLGPTEVSDYRNDAILLLHLPDEPVILLGFKVGPVLAAPICSCHELVLTRRRVARTIACKTVIQPWTGTEKYAVDQLQL